MSLPKITQTLRPTIPPAFPPSRPTTHIKHIVCFGLGNITHPKTRHSIGHVILDSFVDKLGLGSWRKVLGLKSMVVTGEVALPDYVDPVGNFDTIKLTMVKNIPPMNLAGQSLQPVLRQNPIDRSTLYFFLYDHLDQAEGKIQIRKGGSCNGQKGMKSCLSVLGKHDKDAYQIRVGIGKPSSPDFTSSYVLCRSPPAQLAFFQPEGEGTSSIWTSILQTAYPPPGSAKIESVGKQREDQLQAKRAKQLKKEEKMKRDEQRRQEREGEEMEQSGVEDENSVKD